MERDCFSEFQTQIQVHAEIFACTEKDTNTYYIRRQIIEAFYMYIWAAQFPSQGTNYEFSRSQRASVEYV